MRKELERTIENYVVRKSKSWGYINRKMNGMGFNAWPDRLFVGEHGVLIWIEFKRLGEKPTPDQAQIHFWLRQRGQDVQVFDNREDACSYLKRSADYAKMDSQVVSKARRQVHRSTRSRRAAS